MAVGRRWSQQRQREVNADKSIQATEIKELAEGLHVRGCGKGSIKDRLHMAGAGKGRNLGWTPRGGVQEGENLGCWLVQQDGQWNSLLGWGRPGREAWVGRIQGLVLICLWRDTFKTTK